jgi:hypothetical protein
MSYETNFQIGVKASPENASAPEGFWIGGVRAERVGEPGPHLLVVACSGHLARRVELITIATTI